MKTFYLHIGTPKTGTTAIQRFCADNRKVLESKNYCYPEVIKKLDVGLNRNAHPMFAAIMDSNGKRLREEEQKNLLAVFTQIRQCFESYDNVVMSDELAWGATESHHRNFWKQLCQEAKDAGYQVKIIVYLRRQDQLVASRWNQRIKSTNSTTTWTEYQQLQDDRFASQLHYYQKLEGIAHYFGKENIIVRRFDRNGFTGGNIYADFLRTLNLEFTEEYQIPNNTPNLSLSENLAEVKRIMNSLDVPMDRSERNFYVNIFRECAAKAPREDKFSLFTPEEMQEFLKKYKEGNEKIAQEYVDDGAPMFSYESDSHPVWQKDNPYFTDDLIRFFCKTNIELHRENLQLKKQVNSIEKELRTLQQESASTSQRLEKLINSLRHPVRTLLTKNK